MIKYYLDNVIFDLQRGGGVSVMWFELVRRLIKEAADQVAFIDNDSQQNQFRALLDLSGFWVKGEKVNKYYTGLLPVQVQADERFIFHSSYYRYCNHPYAVNVTTVHDFTYEFYRKGLAKWRHSFQKDLSIRHSQAIVCVSENTKRDLLHLLPDVEEAMVRVIYNGVSEDYKLVDNKIDELEDYILFVGKRDAYKNCRFLVDALKDTNVKILFCGPPLSRKEIDYLDSVVGRNRYLAKNYVSNEELNRIYNSVKCLVYPSSYEGFGIPVVEAQKAGCPVIALNASSIPEVCGESPLLMTELSPKELCEKLEMLEDGTLRLDVIQKGVLNATRFNWDASYAQYKQLYEELLCN